MNSKVTKYSTDERLIQSRKEGLEEALEINSMRAHGKILGMDTFSWINPQLDALTSALSSFPFDIIWLGSHEQIQKCLSIQPELVKSIETIIVHDTSVLNFDNNTLHALKNIVCIKGAKHALELMKSMKKENCAWLFSTMGENAKKDREEFEQFISLF